MTETSDSFFLSLAAAEARKFEGATAPNPPVGALLVRDQKILAVGAHQRAGSDHAEVVALKSALQNHGKEALTGATLYVTLEPCNHHGKTPPCTNTILECGVSRVVVGAKDPNRKVQGGGLEFLRSNSIEVSFVDHTECKNLIAPFTKWALTQKPWVVHKMAYRLQLDGSLSMIPTHGKKTFTTIESLKVAHEERRRSDAILTTVKTILADEPMFTVRECADHDGKKRVIAILTREKQNSALEAWINRQQELGFEIFFFDSIDSALIELGKRGVHRVLIEAGPTLSKFLQSEKIADETLQIYHDPNKTTDTVIRTYRSEGF